MKQIILLVAMAALVLTSCKDDNKKRQKWDANAMISLRAAQGVKADNPKYLTAKEIVEQALGISGISDAIQIPLQRGFADAQRDFVNNRLLMWGTDIIAYDGTFEPIFIEAADFVLLRKLGVGIVDTIAYIPQPVIDAAEARIKAAYAVGDYATCYEVMDKAFTFIPITGEEWRTLKAEGKN